MAKRRGWRVCTVAGCPEFTEGGRCPAHRAEAEQRRGTARERGYGGRTWTRARRAVLHRDPTCVVCTSAPATVADHWPTSRRDLIAQGVTDPDAPQRMRGLCRQCHSKATANNPSEKGGWNRR